MKNSILNYDYVMNYITTNAGEKVPYRWSHGADDMHLGDGMIVYSLIYFHKFKNLVCLGSGGGYIKQEPSSVTSAGWHHLIVTYDGSGNKDNINIFWDSSEQTNASGESGTYTSLADVSATVHIGSINGSSEFGGKIDEVRIYNKVLSATEITTNYNNGKSAHP